MANQIKVSDGKITINGVAGFQIEATTLRVFDGRGKVPGWRITHSVFGAMDLVGEDRKALLARLARDAGTSPDAYARRRFMVLEAAANLRNACNRAIGL